MMQSDNDSKIVVETGVNKFSGFVKDEMKMLRELQRIANVSWWVADLTQEVCIFSDFIVEILGLDVDVVSFERFFGMIYSRYSEITAKKLRGLNSSDSYDEIFPIRTQLGYQWVHAKLGYKETDEQGNVLVHGYAQLLSEDSLDKVRNEIPQFRLNDLLRKQKSLSKSLFAFPRTYDKGSIIINILNDILYQFNGDRVYVFRFNWEKRTHSCIYEVTLENVEAEIDSLQDIPVDESRWWCTKLLNGEPVILDTLDEIPPDAAQAKALLERQGINSIMAVPLIARRKTWGYIGIDIVNRYRKWDESDYVWFTSLANVVAICLELTETATQAKQEREYFKNLYQNMPIAYMRLKLVYDKDGVPIDYIHADINPAFESITGLSVRNYLGKRATTVDPAFSLNFERLAKIAANEIRGTYNYHIESNDRYCQLTYYSLAPGEVVILFTDVTDSRNARETLRQKDATLQNIYKNIPVGIEIYDRTGILQDINDMELKIFGIRDKKDVVGVNIFDNPNISDEIKNGLRDGRDVSFELLYDFTKLKGYYPSKYRGVKSLSVKGTSLCDADNKAVSYILIIIDNTQTLGDFHKLQEFKNFFDFIAEFAEIGFYKWNMRTRQGFAVDQWFKNLNVEKQEIGDIISVYGRIHPEDAKKLRDFYAEVEEGNATCFRDEIRVEEGDGWKWLKCNIKVKEYDPENGNIEVVGVNINVSELKETELKLIAAKQRAEEADRLKSAFLANMSHEIRTPLNAIVGFSSILEDAENEEEKKEYVACIQRNTDLLLQLITDILDLSKIEAGMVEVQHDRVDVNALCGEIIRVFKLKTSLNVHLLLDNGLPECVILSDKIRLTQVLSNFISNALKFTNRGCIMVGYNIQRDLIEFYVQDTGIGISPENIDKIFDRFTKLNEFVNGTGLGLAICKSIVEKLGGRIGVESKEGIGSRFWFSLPYDPQCVLLENNAMEQENKVVHLAKGKMATLLIAEDNESNFILLNSILKKSYKIFRARNGYEAVQLFTSQSPDLVLMDVKMPGMDGLTAAGKIRQINPEIPVIALTAFAFESDREKIMEAGCNDYLVKPVRPELLNRTIEKYL